MLSDPPVPAGDFKVFTPNMEAGTLEVEKPANTPEASDAPAGFKVYSPDVDGGEMSITYGAGAAGGASAAGKGKAAEDSDSDLDF